MLKCVIMCFLELIYIIDKMIKGTALLVGLAKLAAAERNSIVDDDNVSAYAFMFNRHGARVP